MFCLTSVWLSGGVKSMIGPGEPKSARRHRVQRFVASQRVDAVLAFVVGHEGDASRASESRSTTGETLPASVSVNCRSSPDFRLSVQML